MISTRGITKRYKIYHYPHDRLKEVILRKSYHKDFLALDNISFELESGKTLGIIGRNGSGKSTLLKILSGIVIPDKGEILFDGTITGLLELGTGFNFEMTGMDNIYMNGILIGMNRDEIDRKKEKIINFSELGDFIYEPLKTYSSGMVMRLAFSIGIHSDPTCFLVDEVLSVGDAYFQQKCIQKLQEFRLAGGTIIFVSHDMNMIMTLCDYALLLEKGTIIAYGVPKSIIDLYISLICKNAHSGQNEVIIQKNSLLSGEPVNITTNEIECLHVKLLDSNRNIITHIYSEDDVIISFSFQSNRHIEEPVFGILVRNRYGVSIFGTNTHLMKKKIDAIYPGENVEVSFRLKISLQPDDYFITIAIDNAGFGINSFREYLLRLNDIAILKVIRQKNSSIYEGVSNLYPELQVNRFISQTTSGSG